MGGGATWRGPTRGEGTSLGGERGGGPAWERREAGRSKESGGRKEYVGREGKEVKKIKSTYLQ